MFLQRLVFAGSCLVGLLTLGCQPNPSAKSDSKQDKPKERVEVRGETMEVAMGSLPISVRVQGSLLADNIITLSAKVAGRIDEAHVDLGDSVTEGQTLFKIDDQEYKMMLDQADAQLSQARAAVGLKPEDSLESLNPENAPPVREARAVWTEAKQAIARIRELSKRSAISDTDLELAEAAERIAEAKFASAQNSVREKIAVIGVQMAQLDLAKRRLVDTLVVSPANGMIQSRAVSKGTYVQTGQPLCVLVENRKLRFRASVPEKYAKQLQTGQTLRLFLDRDNEQQTITVTRISPAIDLQNRSLMFEAEVDNTAQRLRPGSFGEAEVVLDAGAEGIAIPLKCIVRFAGVDKVWKIVGDAVVEQPVLLGRQVGDQVEILKGVMVGDRILKNGTTGRVGVYVGDESASKSSES